MAPIIQTRNADAQLLGSPDHLWAKDRNFAFEAYAASSESFTGETVLGIGNQRQNFSPEIYDFSSNILTIFQPGVYLFSYHSSFTMSGGVAGQVAVYLQQDPATGTFTTVLGTIQYVYLPANLNASMQCVIPLLVGINYRYRIAAIRTSGSGNVSTISQTTELSAILLFNNS